MGVLAGNSEKKTNCLYIHVPLSTLQGTMKAAAVDILRLKNLRGTTTTFLILKRYDIPPTSFYMGLPSPRKLTWWEVHVEYFLEQSNYAT